MQKPCGFTIPRNCKSQPPVDRSKVHVSETPHNLVWGKPTLMATVSFDVYYRPWLIGITGHYRASMLTRHLHHPSHLAQYHIYNGRQRT